MHSGRQPVFEHLQTNTNGNQSQTDWQLFANNCHLIYKKMLTCFNQYESVLGNKCNSAATCLFAIADFSQLFVSWLYSGYILM